MYLCLSQLLTRPKRSEQGFCVGTWARRAISCGTQAFAVTYDEPYFSIWVYDSNHPGEPGRVLVDQIMYYIKRYNERATPFAWNYTGKPLTV